MDAQRDEAPEILEVIVVPELCQRFLNCVRTAKGAFAIDRTTGKSSARPGAAGFDTVQLWKAGYSCPSGAIRFVTSVGYRSPHWEEAAGWDSARHPAAGLRHADRPGTSAG